MTNLYITEFSYPANFTGDSVDWPLETELSTQTVGNAGASTQSTTLHNNTQIVRLHTDSICSVVFGTNPTATTSNRRMAAGQTEYFAVPLSSGLKVAAILNT